ncbi:hypothetical protein CGZ80_01160 [Rhodopirellula sp. MGV]|nr:hypothetical protein CGZ80_01160 [Rhodopirellula sp. MGV]PNY37667.1 protein-tyrosine-phosphatase [Rhodopirellula baltica]
MTAHTQLVVTSTAELIEPLQPFVDRVTASTAQIPAARREFLNTIVEDVTARIQSDDKVSLNFICTHNSRRSHLGQVWFQVAAEHYGLPQIATYSGGTEATACNIRTVRALRRAGLSIVATGPESNPVYLVQCAEATEPMRVFSKVYHGEGNPTSQYIAMMCCSDADKECPIVVGSDARYPLHYEDPKVADNTSEESDRYDERCFQIAQEMFYIVGEVAKRVNAAE